MGQKIAILIQARSGSSRLPGKIYAGLPAEGDRSIIEHIFHRMQKVRGADSVAVLIPESDELLASFLVSRSIPHYSGAGDDVRGRYREAAQFLGVDVVVRATGDNPCVDVAVAEDTIREIKNRQCDLFSYNNLPLGVAVEAFTTRALFADGQPDLVEYREHVSLHIKQAPDRFSVVHDRHASIGAEVAAVAADLPRVTVDMPEDLEVIRRVYESLGDEFGTEQLLALWQSRPELFEGNSHVKQITFPGVHRRSGHDKRQ